VIAGAGPYQGAISGSLIKYFAPILPRRAGSTAPDAPEVVRTDAITITYVPNTYKQTSISEGMPNTSAELKVYQPKNCPNDEDLCGFHEGMEVVIFDETTGSYDAFTITQVQGPAGHLQHRGQTFSREYEKDAVITEMQSNTYFLDRAAKKLMRDDGAGNIVPLVDNVVDLRFDYFGDPSPPLMPVPSSGVANCVLDAAHDPVLPVLTPDEGSLVRLTAAMMSDGPWCGGGTNKYDADLLRIRKVRVTLRVQAANPSLRGMDPGSVAVGGCNPSPYAGMFMCPGSAPGGERFVPDFTVTFDVTPRNLNLTR
jgi:hypothetical protein